MKPRLPGLWICLLVSIGSIAFFSIAGTAEEPPAIVRDLKITVLSTMLADGDARGEWGFAAVVTADGRTLLFDSGNFPDTVIFNAASLNMDLSGIQDVVLSHNHSDHTGGLARLRSEFRAKNPHAFERAHVAPQIFWPRFVNGKAWTFMQETRDKYEAEGGHFKVHDGPAEIFPGVWFTGPVPRTFDERNYPPGILVRSPEGKEIEDTVPEDSSLVINTASGLVILAGCGHAGVVNTASYARKIVRPAPVDALIGGLHLFAASDSQLKWTAQQLRDFHVGHLLGAHCTGLEAVYQLRSQLGLARSSAIVAAVGSSYTWGKGLDAGGRGLAR